MTSVHLVLSLLVLISWAILQFPLPSLQSPQSHSDPAVKVRVNKSYGKLPLSFEANQGQTGAQVKFLSRGSGYSLFLTSTEAVLALGREPEKTDSRTPTPGPHSESVLRVKLGGANPSPGVAGVDELPGKVNYFIGNDSKKWRTNISTYAKVKYTDVYPGVDLIYYGSQRQLEYDFVVAPGADPNTIRLAFEGADEMEVDGEGNLILHFAGGDVIQRAPYIYQEIDGARKRVAGGYILSEIADRKSQIENPTPHSVVGFQLGAYDATKPLIIDPVLAYSTYLGGSGNDRFPIIAVDATGNVYLAGQTLSTDFPTASPVQPNHGGGFDLFVAKLNAMGTELLYSTYLGGRLQETFPSIAVDRAGSAYVIGRTNSLNFPRVNPLQQTYGGGPTDAFVAKLNATGSVLVYSTYLGGSGDETGWDIKVDATGNAYAGGSTSSTNFPTVNAFQPTLAGDSDVFVAKLNAAGSALVYSTYLGGSGDELRTPQLAVDDAGNAYVHGQTTSTNFPTVNPFQPANGGGMDVFVAKLNAAGTSLFYSTYLGGSGSDIARTIAVDGEGNAYVTGSAGSADFPTRNPLQPAYGGGSSDAFVAKLNPSGSALVYSTFLGGNDRDQGQGNGLDAAGNVYVAGFTSSTNFPTVNPLQAMSSGPTGGCMPACEGWVAKLNSSGSALIYSTYFGGSGEEEIVSLAVDAAGNVYVTGQTTSVDYPTVDPLQPTYGGGPADAFVAKISEILASGTFYFAQVGGGGGLSTGVFLTNPSNTKSVSGTVSFFGSDGRPLEGVVSNTVAPFSIPPSGTATISTGGQGDLRSGYARVSSLDPVFANATYSIPGLPSLSVAPSAPPAYLFRVPVSRDRSRGIDVGVAAVNVSDQRATAVFSLADSSGRSIRSLRAARILAPGQQVSSSLGDLLPNLPDIFEGSLQIAALSPLPTQSLVVTAVRFGPGLLNAVRLTSLAKPIPWEKENAE